MSSWNDWADRHVAGTGATEDHPRKQKPEFNEDRSFMLGGEAAFYNVVEGAVLLYSNAIEPWGVPIQADPSDLRAVERIARRLFREQNPDLPFE